MQQSHLIRLHQKLAPQEARPSLPLPQQSPLGRWCGLPGPACCTAASPAGRPARRAPAPGRCAPSPAAAPRPAAPPPPTAPSAAGSCAGCITRSIVYTCKRTNLPKFARPRFSTKSSSLQPASQSCSLVQYSSAQYSAAHLQMGEQLELGVPHGPAAEGGEQLQQGQDGRADLDTVHQNLNKVPRVAA